MSPANNSRFDLPFGSTRESSTLSCLDVDTKETDIRIRTCEAVSLAAPGKLCGMVWGLEEGRGREFRDADNRLDNCLL